MKKIFFGISCIFLMTGCTANANFVIDENEIEENVVIKTENESEYNEIKNWNGFPLPLYYDEDLENPFSSNEKDRNVEYYNVKNNDDEKSISAKTNFKFKDHIKSSIVRGCFQFYNIVDSDNDTKVFSTSTGLICDFDEFKITVNTPYKVVNSNAHKIDIENNIYSWNINNSNRNDINIFLEVDFSKYANEKDIEIKEKQENIDAKDNESEHGMLNENENLIWIGIMTIVVLSIVFTLVLIKKNKKKSEI